MNETYCSVIPSLHFVNINAYTKFDRNPQINSQDIEHKKNLTPNKGHNAVQNWQKSPLPSQTTPPWYQCPCKVWRKSVKNYSIDNVIALHHRVDGLISVSQAFRMRLNPCTTYNYDLIVSGTLNTKTDAVSSLVQEKRKGSNKLSI